MKYKNKKLQKLLYRIVDFFLVRSSFPIFGKLANKIRIHYARKISKDISKKAYIDKHAFLSHKITIKDFGCVGKNCVLPPYVTIGENTMMGPDVLFFTLNHKRSSNNENFVEGYDEPRPIRIGKNCWIGQRSIILGGVTIGDGVTVGAGCVVTKNVPNNCLVVGNPGVIKKRYE